LSPSFRVEFGFKLKFLINFRTRRCRCTVNAAS
jgi:hypothetical protein